MNLKVPFFSQNPVLEKIIFCMPVYWRFLQIEYIRTIKEPARTNDCSVFYFLSQKLKKLGIKTFGLGSRTQDVCS